MRLVREARHFHYGPKTVFWYRVRYGETVRERERRRPVCSGDAANRNGVFVHDLDLEQISRRALGLYSLNDYKTMKSLQKYTRNDQPRFYA
jgi:hypothetical protein